MSAPRGDTYLLSCFACDPHAGSEPYVGWKWAAEVYSGRRRVILTRRFHEASLRAVDLSDATFVYFDLPFCSGVIHHHKLIKPYYVLWQIFVLPYALYIALRYRVSHVHHITYNVMDFPGLLWLIPRTRFLWGPVGGGQVPPAALKDYYGDRWTNQVARAWLKRSVRVNPLVRLALWKCTLVAAANTETLRRLQPLVPDKDRIHLLLETASDKLAAQSRVPRHPRTVIWVGRFEDRKAPGLALEVAAAVEEARPGCFRFRMLGEGPLRPAIEDAARSAANVAVVGPVPFSAMLQEYACSDLLLFTSLQDTSGNVVLESLSQGIPVVALNHHGAADILAGGGGSLVEVGPRATVVQDFRDALITLLDDDLAQTLSRQALDNISTNYTWSVKRTAWTRMLQGTLREERTTAVRQR
jgi:glycosyltransferase involved in cell wall biosynthesis